MKIKIKEILTEYDGDPVIETKMVYNSKTKKKEPEEAAVTARDLLHRILNQNAQGEVPTAEDLNERDIICRKIFADNEPDLTLHERSMILERINKIYNSPRIYGFVKDILDPSDEVKVEKNSKKEKAETAAPTAEN